MKNWKFLRALEAVLFSFLLVGCQKLNFGEVGSNAAAFISSEKVFSVFGNNDGAETTKIQEKSLDQILAGSLADVNEGKDFSSTISLALEKDPMVISQRRVFEAKLAAIDVNEAGKDYQVTSTVYGGIEDITDNTKGIALGLNASRLISDGGLLDAQIASSKFEAEAAKFTLRATLDERAVRLCEIWLDLEKYEGLQRQIDERLAVLDPLIGQLERVAEAGIGDVSKVTAAQRTVSGIRVTQTNISEGLAKARLNFSTAFGSVDKSIGYDASFIEELLPEEVGSDLAQMSPTLLSKYSAYKAALAKLAAVKAKDEYKIGFEARAMMPFAGSEYSSDESFGLVARKMLFNGGLLESEINEAEALAKSAMAEIKASYRIGESIVSTAYQSIESMNKAIELARQNASVTADEIVYLRQQLIIGGSTLDSVLSAEARLYEAESKELIFYTDKLKAQLRVAGALGLISSALEL